MNMTAKADRGASSASVRAGSVEFEAASDEEATFLAALVRAFSDGGRITAEPKGSDGFYFTFNQPATRR